MKGTTNSQRGVGDEEKLVISLKTNQISHEDLIDAKFSVVINGNATEYTWQGTSITIPIPSMLNYTVEFGEVEGYVKPESVTHTAVAGNDRFVTGTYNTELVTVNVSADKGTVSGYEVSIYKLSGGVEQITGYTELEYVETYYNQYIDTGFVPDAGFRVTMDMSFVELPNDGCMIGCMPTSSTYIHPIAYRYAGGWHIDRNATGVSASVGTRYYVESIRKTGNIKLTVNGQVLYYNTGTPTFTTLCPLYLGVSNAYYNNSRSYLNAIKIYEVKIYNESDEIVRDYVPVKNSDGVIGLYDKVNHTFNPSRTSTAFKSGAEKGEIVFEKSTIIKDLLYTQTTQSASHKIAWGTSYMVEAINAGYHVAPESQSFVSSHPQRTVDIVYQYNPMGVFTVDVDGNLGDKDSPISNGVAVAVITENVKVMFNPTQGNGFVTGKNVGSNNVSLMGNALPIYTTYTTAQFDYNGESNHQILYNLWKNQSGSESWGVMLANAFRFATNKKQSGRLPSLGEVVAIYDNLSDVKKALYNAGITSSESSSTGLDSRTYLWTTTRASDFDGLVRFYRHWSNSNMPPEYSNYLYDLLYVTSDF